MQELIHTVFMNAFSNEHLETLHDSAVLPPQEGQLAFTTDSYVVHSVVFFPEGTLEVSRFTAPSMIWPCQELDRFI